MPTAGVMGTAKFRPTGGSETHEMISTMLRMFLQYVLKHSYFSRTFTNVDLQIQQIQIFIDILAA